MELLYFVDRTLTAICQAISRQLTNKLHLSMRSQSLLGTLLGVLVGTIIANIYKFGRTDQEFKDLGILIGLSIIAVIIHPPVSKLLYHLHRFFDIDGAINPDKLYENGYEAWGFVIISVLFLILGINLKFTWTGHMLIVAGVWHITNNSFISFVQRKKGNPRLKKYVSEALANLLERCRDWLVPRPIPQT